MKTRVYAYRGMIAISSDPEADGVIVSNLPSNENNGFIVKAEDVEIDPKAFDLMKVLKRSKDDLGDFMVYQEPNHGLVFSWWGHKKEIKETDRAVLSKDTDIYLMTPYLKELEVPESLKKAVDAMWAEDE